MRCGGGVVVSDCFSTGELYVESLKLTVHVLTARDNHCSRNQHSATALVTWWRICRYGYPHLHVLEPGIIEDNSEDIERAVGLPTLSVTTNCFHRLLHLFM